MDTTTPISCSMWIFTRYLLCISHHIPGKCIRNVTERKAVPANLRLTELPEASSFPGVEPAGSIKNLKYSSTPQIHCSAPRYLGPWFGGVGNQKCWVWPWRFTALSIFTFCPSMPSSLAVSKSEPQCKFFWNFGAFSPDSCLLSSAQQET